MNVIMETATHKIESAGVEYVPTDIDLNIIWRDAEVEQVGASQAYRFAQHPEHQQAVDYMTALFNYDGTGERP